MTQPSSSDDRLLCGLGPSVACGLGHGLVLPLHSLETSTVAAHRLSSATMAVRAVEVGAQTAAAEAALQSGMAVATLWPHRPARFTTFALPPWSVAVITPDHPAAAAEPTAFLGRTLIGKAAATFAARAVATTEALREGDLELLQFALDDSALNDLLGAALPGLQPALLAARSAGLPAGLTRFRGRLSIVALHPEPATVAAAAEAAADRFAAHALSCEVTLTRFARCQPEPQP